MFFSCHFYHGLLGEISARDFLDRVRFTELRQTSLVGGSARFVRCVNELTKAAQSEANLLLLGETGTGKEMIARSVHALSHRSSERFVAVNCANLDGNRLENELFGHERGSFTGADRVHHGQFEAVGAGTLLLDEIGDMALSLQAKLLRAIEQREFYRVGGTVAVPLRARLVCATSVDLDDAAASNAFRPDLLARVNQLRIVMPAVRDRPGDVLLLLRHFLDKHSRGRAVALSPSAREMLERFDYPMNVRQVENAIVSALSSCYPGSMILPKHLPAEITRPAAKKLLRLEIPGELGYAGAREAALRAVDKIYLEELLIKNNGNQSSAADEGQIDRKTFATRLKNARDGGEDG